MIPRQSAVAVVVIVFVGSIGYSIVAIVIIVVDSVVLDVLVVIVFSL